ncbi:cobalamin-dependent protein [Methanospirillum sp.]|uniref:cobalamin B12-binding domain-containing protein n=2 Tax=Methanospirillum sp. TaxID=45200 RepID=UPI002BD91F98|nr:cobalamin-dependent protein [Methanospirillum sp.]HPP76609.1 cobalamin-dependent protein [Methanospirillum sp.]
MTEPLQHLLIAEQVMKNLEKCMPGIITGYSKEQREKCLQDILYHLNMLSQAVYVDSPAIFVDYIQWTRILFSGIGLPIECLHATLQALSQIYEEHGNTTYYTFIQAAEKSLKKNPEVSESFLPDDPFWNPVVREFIDDLISLRRSQAHSLVRDLYAKGTGLKELYLSLFQPALYETGRLWHISTITVAQEHYCTSAVQQIIAGFYPDIMRQKKTGKRMLASCVPGELHEVGVRMVADFFELSGWETIYLGSNVPFPSIMHLIKTQKIPLLALSCTISLHLDHMDTLIRMIRDDKELCGIKIIAGGYPFRKFPDLWMKIGADASAKDAEDAVRIGENLVVV